MEPNKIKSAAIGGVVAGLLSAIPLVSICCCIWTLGGGFLAVFMYNKDKGGRGVTPGEGATLGAMAGGVAAVIYLVIAIPIALIAGPMQAEMLKGYGIDMPAGGAGMSILGGLMGAVVIVVLTTLGGLIASFVYKPTGGGPAGGAPPYGGGGTDAYGGGGAPPYGGQSY